MRLALGRGMRTREAQRICLILMATTCVTALGCQMEASGEPTASSERADSRPLEVQVFHGNLPCAYAQDNGYGPCAYRVVIEALDEHEAVTEKWCIPMIPSRSNDKNDLQGAQGHSFGRQPRQLRLVMERRVRWNWTSQSNSCDESIWGAIKGSPVSTTIAVEAPFGTNRTNSQARKDLLVEPDSGAVRDLTQVDDKTVSRDNLRFLRFLAAGMELLSRWTIVGSSAALSPPAAGRMPTPHLRVPDRCKTGPVKIKEPLFVYEPNGDQHVDVKGLDAGIRHVKSTAGTATALDIVVTPGCSPPLYQDEKMTYGIVVRASYRVDCASGLSRAIQGPADVYVGNDVGYQGPLGVELSAAAAAARSMIVRVCGDADRTPRRSP
jgi:hypothetical protein